MFTYRTRTEVELNILQVCRSGEMRLSHIAQKARLNGLHTKRHVLDLLSKGELTHLEKSVAITEKGLQRLTLVESSRVYSHASSKNYMKIVEEHST